MEDSEMIPQVQVDPKCLDRRLTFEDKFHHLSWLKNRELGLKPKLGTTSKLSKQIYRNMQIHVTCKIISEGDSDQSTTNSPPWAGGIFNLEFSPDGSSLVAACSKNSFMVFDPLNHRFIRSVNGAHSDSVNCVKFLDNRIFATGSDDCTVALWDLRNLQKRMKLLEGHSNWVKNVDFSKKDNTLVTSGFDGSVFIWDLNSETENGLLYRRAFQNNGLMRMILAPDESKMIVCTTGGYIMIIHDLDLTMLDTDLYGFQPNVYRLMQISEQILPAALKFNHLFRSTRKRNRIEFITDFPEGDNAEVISSLQVHPQGWCVVSRNGSTDESSEWTCVHDIQEVESSKADDSEAEDPYIIDQNAHRNDGMERRRMIRPYRSGALRGHSSRRAVIANSAISGSFDIWEALLQIDAPGSRPSMLYAVGRNPTPGLRVQRMASGISPQVLEEADDETENDDRQSPEEVQNENLPVFFPSDLSLSSTATREMLSQVNLSTSDRISPARGFYRNGIYHNRPRLSHFIEESNTGKGFIKETSFSADGRIIGSPFARGVRLLAFSKECEELSKCFPNKPVKLEEIAVNFAHNKVVLCTKFSPTHPLLVSGCLGGHIAWYQPVL